MPKTKSLESILKSSPKSEARLIGYDETPINVVVAEDNVFEKLKMTEPPGGNYNSTMSSDSVVASSSPSITPLNIRSSFPFNDVRGQPSEIIAGSSCDTGSLSPTKGMHGKINCQVTMEQLSHFLTQNFFQVGCRIDQQDHACLNFVLLIIGNLHLLIVVKRKVSAI